MSTSSKQFFRLAGRVVAGREASSFRVWTPPCRGIAITSTRLSSSGGTTPKRPSPYRLIPLSTFLADFAPLHVQGWRLEPLPGFLSNQKQQAEGMAQLQDRRLVRRYDFEQGQDGWRKLISFVQTAGEVVEKEDHHPTILITPSSDYQSSTGDTTPISDTAGYVVAISTHTHTPLPPVKYPKNADGSQDSMRPGVTGKDLRLAMALEEIYQYSA